MKILCQFWLILLCGFAGGAFTASATESTRSGDKFQKKTPTIFVCTDARGQKIFTDHGCHKQQARTTHNQTNDNFSTLHFTPLSKAEQQSLADQTKQTRAQQRARQKIMSKQRNRLAQQDAAKERVCIAAQRGLKKIEQRRRKGYALSESAQLSAMEAEHEDNERRNC